MTYRFTPGPRIRAAATATGTAAITLALLAGMPYVLWQATGVPWPDRIGSWQDLDERVMQPITDPVIIDLLAMVGWVCWAAFACSILKEVAWYASHVPQLLRDRTAHTAHLETLSVQRTLAALCIGTLVLALVSLWRPYVAHAHPHATSGDLRVPVASTAPVTPAASSETERPSMREARIAESRCVEYTVAEGDTLWDIAATHMGDPLKWPRIYALNKTRVQSDGGRLSDPDRITPGWQLGIPVISSASSPRPPAPPTPPAAPAKPSSPSTSAEGLPTQPAPGLSPRREAESRATPGQSASHVRSGPVAISVGTASIIGITSAAGILAALRFFRFYQNRSRRPGLNAQVPPLSPAIEKAVLAASEAALPRTTDADPKTLITRRTPPAPPQPAPTVTIGIANAAEVPLATLARAGGCSWTGPGAEAAARALLTGILTAAERQRPGTPQVKGVLTQDLADRLLPGMPPKFSALTVTDDFEHAIRCAEEHLIAHAHHQRDTQDTEDEPATTKAGEEESRGPGSLVLLAQPDAAHAGRLTTLADRSWQAALIVLTLGALPGATSWHIAHDGAATQQTATGGQFDDLQLFHLAPQAGRDVLEVLLTGHDERPRLRMVPGARAAAPAPDSLEQGTAEESDDEPPAAGPDPAEPVKPEEPQQTKPVHLNVLGPVTLYVQGNPEPVGGGLRDEVREFLALLAVHPTGLIADDIARNLRLSEDPDQVARDLKNLRRAVRRVLRAATGQSRAEFIQLHGELHKLNPGMIETDLAAFTQALHEAATTTHTPQRLSALRRAAEHYHGPFAHGGDYPWSDSVRASLASKAADAVAALAHHAEHTGARQDADDALALLDKAITLSPTHERLYQHAIRLHQAAGRHDTARHTFTLLERNLKELGLEPDPATRALLTTRTRTAHLG
ncbi:transcriptional regulator, SARP family protein [Streptomyces bingchenggensis BCW-1]|uniref:Transcriptional regulator, SARP family protein n=3 Tax=Streptomyces TaxID=1883 RepID=D7BUB4_STRBB|nr:MULTISPECIES: BTAD domain-containing putative transcriptional regulator [Streptomyces]ADI11663.1 transcriptional regulator, SARP family protein [Streptomyces bingchenggensis BCW-1]